MTFSVFNESNAPEDSKAQLTQSKDAFGFIPNLHGVLAQSPQTLTAYKTLHGLFQKTSFNKEELTVVWQTLNVINDCHYCIPAHSTIADMMGVDAKLNLQLVSQQPLDDKKLNTLYLTTKALYENRGKLSAAQKEAFFNQGYGNQQLLEILLGISQKTISNFTNQLADTPVDEEFKAFA